MNFPIDDALKLVFFDKYKIMAVYGHTAAGNALIERFILRTIAGNTNRYQLQVSQGMLMIDPFTGSTSGMIPKDYDFIGTTSNVFLDNAQILIGTGDVRDGITERALTRYTIGDSGMEIVLECPADYRLKIWSQS